MEKHSFSDTPHIDALQRLHTSAAVQTSRTPIQGFSIVCLNFTSPERIMQAPIFPCSFYLSQLHPIQILRLGDVEVNLDAVAAGQGHGSDQVGCDKLALGWGRVVKHFRPGKELLVLILQLLGEPVAVGQSSFQRFNIGG